MTPEQGKQNEEEPIRLDSEPEAAPAEGPLGESISLVEGEQPEGGAQLRAFGAGVKGVGKKEQFQRGLNVTGQGATRCRVFHSKIAVSSLEFMENQINDWLDKENAEVKQVGHIIGIMEGKRPEPNLVVMVWY